ncbi:MAG: peptide chain release factor 2 [Thermodesulfovibrionales bacterium]
MVISSELREKFNLIRKRIEELRGYLELEDKRSKILEINEELTREEVWSDREKVQALQKKKAELENIVEPFDQSIGKEQYLAQSIHILDEEDGSLFVEEISRSISELESDIEKLELKYFLSGKLDKNNVFVEIHPGAGGTESQDWAQMLLRMYLKWAEKNGYKTEIVDISYGEEAGIKSATFTVTGPFAYGMLKGEAGIHRLVRISPFDANKRRHTSFVAVLIYPEVEEDIEIEIEDGDLKIDTYRASGAGGQHVNKTSSAVRITHIPSGIVVACQNQRSQHKNKATVMKILKARLYNLKLKEQEKEMEGIIGDKKDIAWGNQIRSYVLHPYRMIKDHRTSVEVGNIDPVLDGDLNVFLEAYLKQKETNK